jgi:hypothetical protein
LETKSSPQENPSMTGHLAHESRIENGIIDLLQFWIKVLLE